MPEHVHVHVPHELEGHAGNGHADGSSNSERWMEIIAAFLLAVTTLCIAWSGYQAAKWSGLQARRYTQASAARSLANRDQTTGSQARIQDLLNFNRWLEVTTQGNVELQQLYERRFRDEFRPAFDAWIAQDPLQNVNAIPSPLRMPQYVLESEQHAEKLEKLADVRFEQGKIATENADKYVFTTVFFAAVLFFAGISLRFEWMRLRMVMLGLASVFLIYGLIQLATMPTH
ncbi:MAG: hypothetical protein ABW073_09705 [Acidimicrobiia bacterium]